MRVLITSGATREPIDGVRFISNISSGATGAAIADAFVARGAKLVYLHGIAAQRPSQNARCIEYSDFAELDDKLRSCLQPGHFDAVIHLAAVSDFSIADIEIDGRSVAASPSGKLSSAGVDQMRIRLTRNFKILQRLAGYAGRSEASTRPLIVGFKLTNTDDADTRSAAVTRLFAGGGVDYVVHNDLGERSSHRLCYRVYADANTCVHSCTTTTELAAQLFGLIDR